MDESDTNGRILDRHDCFDHYEKEKAVKRMMIFKTDQASKTKTAEESENPADRY